MMEARMSRPFGLSFMIVLYDVMALFTMAIGALSIAELLSQGTDDAAAVLNPAILIVMPLLLLIAMHHTWKGSSAGRIVLMTLLAMGTAGNLLVMALSAAGGAVVATVPLAIAIAMNLVFLFVLGSPAVRAYCAR